VTPFGSTELVIADAAPAARGDGPAATTATRAQLAKRRIERTVYIPRPIGQRGEYSEAAPVTGGGPRDGPQQEVRRQDVRDVYPILYILSKIVCPGA